MRAGFADVYQQLCDLYPDPHERGRQLEPLIQDVLRTDRQWRDRYTDVWRWSEWPDRDGPDNWCDLVARRPGGGLTAFQCKCYDPASKLYQSNLDSFLGRDDARFDELYVVSTTSNYSPNLLRKLTNRRTPVQLFNLFDLQASAIDWDAYLLDESEELVALPRKTLRPHQVTALRDVDDGFVEHDRGKLIMACGTGKTFTALRGAEEIAKPGGRVLFAAPSISLVAQALREWTRDSEIPIRAFAVCSDPKVGRGDSDGARLYDLPIPATTNPNALAKAAAQDAPDKLTVVFSTYQSMQVIRDAQAAGMPQFDLAVCDEAHRTTGYTLKDEERSNFLMIHDAEAIRARKRLYMTATPRLYNPKARAKAEKADAYVASMDDETTYGPEFHRLGFADAVEQDLLSDYKVSILVMTEEQIAEEWQEELAEVDGGLPLDDIGRVIGCLNGLAKLDPERQEFKEDPEPMRRAVAFSNTIKQSKHFVELVGALQDEAGVSERGIRAEARHVDGTTGVLKRAAEIAWLGGETMVMRNQCHILSNARCLTEGIDVPALDAVLFLQPRKSQIDVVQAVGRVMRRAEGKKYGYIILPVVVPAGEDPADMLDRNNAYAHVWEVLQALRSHDERFDAWVNKLDLNRSRDDSPVNVIGVGPRKRDEDDESDNTTGPEEDARQFVLAGLDDRLEQWREAIYAKIVQRCGERRYWEQWADSVSDIARRHQERINAIINAPGGAGDTFHEFVDALRGNLNESISDDDAAGMLSQHLITKPVFDALFAGSKFAELNPVSQAMQGMIDALADKGLEAETEELSEFYASVRRRAEGIDNAEGRQRVAIELYDNFFRKAFPKDAERLGIVYTPVEIVNFIIRSVEDLLQQEFGASLSDEGVHILDPFTGTGTFIAQLLQSDFIKPDDLQRKYRSEIHANEIMLLAYYIAAVNIENTYHEKMREAGIEPDYEPFDGIVLTDTFQSSEPHDRQDTTMFPRNNARMERQLGLDIRVILGNPPWSVGQRSSNDDNRNLRYSALDGRTDTPRDDSIAFTYVALASPGLKRNLYDSYVRAIRWASNRVLAQATGGIVAFVTNSGFLDTKAFDGFRKTVTSEFDKIVVYNLRGDQRTAGEQSRKEGGKVFGSGSRAGVAVLILVRRAGKTASSEAAIQYRDIGHYLDRERKLEIVAQSWLSDGDWRSITPNAHGDWINPRSDRFLALHPIVSVPREPQGSAPILELGSFGLITARDAWVFGASAEKLQERIRQAVQFYNSQAGRSEVTDRDPTKFKWDPKSLKFAQQGKSIEFDPVAVRTAQYRPFFRQKLYMNRDLNSTLTRMPRMFPTPDVRTPAIVVESKLRVPGRTPAILAVDVVPCVHLGSDVSHVLPRYTYEAAAKETQGSMLPARHDNITENTLAAFQTHYGSNVAKDHIFAYVYGILHSPDYRERYATDLAKMLPRIPEVASADDFFAFAEAGQRLLDLHIGYEEAEPYALHEQVAIGAPDGDARWYVEKMRWAGNRKQPDRSSIIVNDWVVLSGIPDEAHRYVVGPRTALEWLIDRYRVRVDKASGIVNDVNDWGLELDPPNPRYIIELIQRVTTVSVETMRIVDALPPLVEADQSAS